MVACRFVKQMAGAPAVQAANEQRDEAAAKVKASAEAESGDAAGGEDAAAAAGGAGAGAGAGATDGDAAAVAAAAAAKAEEDKKPKSLTAKCEADLSDLQKLWVQTLVSAYMAAQDSTTESEALKTVERSMVLVSHAPAVTVGFSSSSVPSSLPTLLASLLQENAATALCNLENVVAMVGGTLLGEEAVLAAEAAEAAAAGGSGAAAGGDTGGEHKHDVGVGDDDSSGLFSDKSSVDAGFLDVE